MTRRWHNERATTGDNAVRNAEGRLSQPSVRCSMDSKRLTVSFVAEEKNQLESTDDIQKYRRPGVLMKEAGGLHKY